MPSRRIEQPQNLSGVFNGLGLRADYNAAKPSRYRRVRRGVASMGSGADYHYRSEFDYLKIMEQARDMARNDVIAGSLVQRAVTNEIQDGMKLDTQTGSKEADALIDQKWNEWTADPDLCDRAGENDFHAQELLVSAAVKVDGDILALPTLGGSLQLVEGHRLRSPNRGKNKNAIHGILLDEFRRRLEYWVTEDDIDPSMPVKVADIRKIPARDEHGHKQVFHVFDPKRVTQTRGISAFAPIFDILGQFEDLQFAKMVQAQVVSCFAIIREMELDAPKPPSRAKATGARSTTRFDDGTDRLEEGISPGQTIQGRNGEKITGFSPNVPNTEYFEHVHLILSLIGVNLGLPLVLVLMDARQTNFSGWRGAVDQARMGFRVNQTNMIRRFHEPVYLWKLRQWLTEDGKLRSMANEGSVDIFSHRWNSPTWPYIEPKKDAEADALLLSQGLSSYRRVHAQRNSTGWDEMAAEIVEDREKLVRLAVGSADKINQEFPDAKLDWRELAGDMFAKIAPKAKPDDEEEDDDNDRSSD